MLHLHLQKPSPVNIKDRNSQKPYPTPPHSMVCHTNTYTCLVNRDFEK